MSHLNYSSICRQRRNPIPASSSVKPVNRRVNYPSSIPYRIAYRPSPVVTTGIPTDIIVPVSPCYPSRRIPYVGNPYPAERNGKIPVPVMKRCVTPGVIGNPGHTEGRPYPSAVRVRNPIGVNNIGPPYINVYIVVVNPGAVRIKFVNIVFNLNRYILFTNNNLSFV